MLDSIFTIGIVVVVIVELLFSFLPIGNENSTVRRLPWITFAIMSICAIVFYVTLPLTAGPDEEFRDVGEQVIEFIGLNQEILADENVRQKLVENGLLNEVEADQIRREISRDPALEREYSQWLRSPQAARLREQLDDILENFKVAMEARFSYQYGLAPNGKWKIHQLVTYAFLHGSAFHLFGNLIFFFAIAFSLEDLWGRSLFLGFYLAASVVSCLPYVFQPANVPLVGASGAISAVMGAFLVRLYKTKIKIGWTSFALLIPFMVMGRKPWGVINLPAYVFLPYYFMTQILFWWYINKTGQISMTAFTVHIAGFVFGVAFALVMKLSRAEENYINPKIEAKVSFSASPAVTHALAYLDRGEFQLAERRLKAHLVKGPEDVSALLALIQVYERAGNLEQLNATYSRLIHLHLKNGDKEAALYAYDGLLSCYPDNQVDVRLPMRDWLALCEYLKETGMNREAAVEFERVIQVYPDDTLAVRACVQGGEAALAAFDNERALRLFQRAEGMKASPPFAARIMDGLEKCKMRLDSKTWSQQPGNTQPLPNKL